MATLIWRLCATCSVQSEWLCIIENAAPLKSARLRGFGGAACVLGEMCEGAGALARVLENEGCVPGRCIALSRRCVGALYRIVNCGPAQCCVWPVLAPAEAFVRAGAGLRGGRVRCGVFRGESAGAKCGSRTAAAPQTAPKSLRLSGLSSFDSRCGGVSRGEGRSGTTET